MAQNFKKNKRKKQIKEVAIKLISEKGYRNTSVQDILNEMNYSASGFYNCYSSKVELFGEIIEDGLNYKTNELKKYNDNNDKTSKKEFAIEGLLNKMLDSSVHRKNFIALLIEMKNNDELLNLFNNLYPNVVKSFVKLCELENFNEFLELSNYEFSLFMISIMIGSDIFNQHGNTKYRNMLKDMLEAYFEKINLFN